MCFFCKRCMFKAEGWQNLDQLLNRREFLFCSFPNDNQADCMESHNNV